MTSRVIVTMAMAMARVRMRVRVIVSVWVDGKFGDGQSRREGCRQTHTDISVCQFKLSLNCV